MEEKNAVDSFLEEANSKEDIFAENQGTVEPEVSEEKEEKPLPFHKDPKVQRYVEKQIKKALESAPSAEREFKEVVSADVDEVVNAFTTIIGNDTQEKVKALDALKRTLNGADERASKKAIESFQKQISDQQKAEAEADSKASEELDNYFDEIEETYNVDLTSNSASAKAVRAQFIDYVRKIAHKDENGDVDSFPDLVSAWEEFSDKNKRPASRAKELANRGLVRSSDTNTPTQGGNSWKDVDRYFDKLFKK